MVVEDAETGYVGAVVRVEYGRIDLEDRYGKTRGFPLGPGYLLDGLPVILTAPRCAAAAGPRRTASGSVAGGQFPTHPGRRLRRPIPYTSGPAIAVATTGSYRRPCWK